MIYTIDCTCITEKQQLHRILQQALLLPQWYGHNLDALYDCLTERRTDYTLILKGWDPTRPWAAGFASVFADAQADNPHLTVFFQ